VAISSHFWVDDVTSVEPVRFAPGQSFMRNLMLPLIQFDGGVAARVKRSVREALQRPLDFYSGAYPAAVGAAQHGAVLIMQTVENRMAFERGRSIWTLFTKNLVSVRDKRVPIPPVIEAGAPWWNALRRRWTAWPGRA
jgi:hypothetical protein